MAIICWCDARWIGCGGILFTASTLVDWLVENYCRHNLLRLTGSNLRASPPLIVDWATDRGSSPGSIGRDGTFGRQLGLVRFLLEVFYYANYKTKVNKKNVLVAEIS